MKKETKVCIKNKVAVFFIITMISCLASDLYIHENPLRAEYKYINSAFNEDDLGDGVKKKKKAKKRQIKGFTLNFKEAEISEFLNVMSELIGKNIIIDDKVKGKITIKSVKRIPVQQAYNLMKSILEVKGLAVVETPHLIKIIPIKDAIKKNVEVIVDGKKIKMDEDKVITYLYEIKNIDANEVANALKSLKSGNTDIIVYQPLNTIIFSGNENDIKGLIEIAKALDKSVGEEEMAKGNIHVVHLENADAEQLANVLSRIPFSENALIQKGPISTPTPNRNKPNIRKSAKSQRVTGTQRTAAQTKSDTKLSIIANKETNSLIITATPDDFRTIMSVIKKLDIVREQVLIEALIVEMSAESGWSFGIDWMLGNQSGSHLYGGSQIFSSNPSAFATPSPIEGKTLALPLSQGFQLGYLSDKSILGFALLNMSETDKNFNVLSTPQLLTTDNQEAELNIGEEIPVPANNRISETGTQFYTFEYKSVGIKFKITPHITKKENITLDLYLEVNSVLGQTQVLEGGSYIPPTLGKRDIKTKVSVFDGKTIVVGGLIRNNNSIEETKVPILGDIPLLGWLFKRKSKGYTKTNLMLFITPHIVTKKKSIEKLTNQKQEEQRRLKFRQDKE